MENKFPLFHKIIATSCGFGYFPYGPGTMGAVFGVIVWLILAHTLSYSALMIATVALILIFTALGTWSADIAEKFWGEDPSRVVMDETVGVWISLLAVPASLHWGYWLAAFVLFRFFDIVKPLGVRRMEDFKGGFGIMADDILAGIYGAIVILIARVIINFI